MSSIGLILKLHGGGRGVKAPRALPLIAESSINITFKDGDIAIWR